MDTRKCLKGTCEAYFGPKLARAQASFRTAVNAAAFAVGDFAQNWHMYGSVLGLSQVPFGSCVADFDQIRALTGHDLVLLQDWGPAGSWAGLARQVGCGSQRHGWGGDGFGLKSQQTVKPNPLINPSLPISPGFEPWGL